MKLSSRLALVAAPMLIAAACSSTPQQEPATITTRLVAPPSPGLPSPTCPETDPPGLLTCQEALDEAWHQYHPGVPLILSASVGDRTEKGRSVQVWNVNYLCLSVPSVEPGRRQPAVASQPPTGVTDAGVVLRASDGKFIVAGMNPARASTCPTSAQPASASPLSSSDFSGDDLASQSDLRSALVAAQDCLPDDSLGQSCNFIDIGERVPQLEFVDGNTTANVPGLVSAIVYEPDTPSTVIAMAAYSATSSRCFYIREDTTNGPSFGSMGASDGTDCFGRDAKKVDSAAWGETIGSDTIPRAD